MTTAFPETAASWARLKTAWRALMLERRRSRGTDLMAKLVEVWPLENADDLEVHLSIRNLLLAMSCKHEARS
jgi:hypothetical protein